MYKMYTITQTIFNLKRNFTINFNCNKCVINSK